MSGTVSESQRFKEECRDLRLSCAGVVTSKGQTRTAHVPATTHSLGNCTQQTSKRVRNPGKTSVPQWYDRSRRCESVIRFSGA